MHTDSALPSITAENLQHLYNPRLIAGYNGYPHQDIGQPQACVQTAEPTLAACIERLPGEAA